MRKQQAGGNALDGNALRTQRTRARILARSLELFNAHGEPHVTTAMIARELDISAGNLYYHFPTKDAIVEALFERFRARIDVAPPGGRVAAEALEDLWLYLHLMLEAIWEYRFLYRSLDDLLGRNRRLGEALRHVMERKRLAIAGFCEALVAAGAMRASPGQIRALAANVLLVATYWLSFRTLVGPADRHPDAASALGQGAHQVISLISPYLEGEARRHLERLARSYLD